MNDASRGDGAQRQFLITIGLAALVVVSLGVGFVAGYVTGGGRPAMAPAASATLPAGGVLAPAGQPIAQAQPPGGAIDGHTVGDGGAVTCVYDLAVKDQWMLAGMTCICKEPHCNRTPLLACHCDNAHSMKSLAKQMIVEGKTAQEIGAELEKRYGPGVLPAGGVPRGPKPQGVKP